MSRLLSNNLVRETQPTNQAVRLRFVSEQQRWNAQTQFTGSAPNNAQTQFTGSAPNNEQTQFRRSAPNNAPTQSRGSAPNNAQTQSRGSAPNNAQTQSRESAPNNTSNGSNNRRDNNHAANNRKQCCSFCWNLAKQKNEQKGLPPPDKDSLGVWSFHSLAFRGAIKCPLLWFHVCKICGATHVNAHTEKHCPKRQQWKGRTVPL